MVMSLRTAAVLKEMIKGCYIVRVVKIMIL